MFKTLSQGIGFALSLVTLLGPVHADVELPAQCWPNCYDFQQECTAWFGPGWYYCGYNAGWVYCCFPGE
jgi:hypothetical protein